MITTINQCRVCKSRNLDFIVGLGKQTLTGVFPQNSSEEVVSAPLDLMRCAKCGLVQLRDSVDRHLLYGDSYGYRSGINEAMVKHLNGIVRRITEMVKLQQNDLVVDIGSNDATLLMGYSPTLRRVGIDPLGKKFSKYYDNITLICDYFNEGMVSNAKVITSIAMLYDLENPLAFMRAVKKSLAQDGIWATEQSYMPAMIKRTAYDVICHEHLEYYGLTQIKWMADKVGLKIIDVSLNNMNNGSFCVVLAKGGYKQNTKKVNKLLKEEKKLERKVFFDNFRRRIEKNCNNLRATLIAMKYCNNKVIAGYGASTKGNVILQYCKLDKYVDYIADRNPEKWGRVTPGTHILIVSEERLREDKPDYLLVLPYHFKKEFLKREQAYLKSGGQMIFPLPKIQIMGG